MLPSPWGACRGPGPRLWLRLRPGPGSIARAGVRPDELVLDALSGVAGGDRVVPCGRVARAEVHRRHAAAVPDVRRGGNLGGVFQLVTESGQNLDETSPAIELDPEVPRGLCGRDEEDLSGGAARNAIDHLDVHDQIALRQTAQEVVERARVRRAQFDPLTHARIERPDVVFPGGRRRDWFGGAAHRTRNQDRGGKQHWAPRNQATITG